MGIVMTTILGIVGSVVAGFLGRQLGWYHDGEPAGWIASVVGAIIVLFVVGLIAKKRLTQRPARPVPARKTGRPLAGRPVALLPSRQPARGSAAGGLRRLRRARRRGGALGPAAAQRLVQVHQVGQARARVSTSDCWALYSERCESSTLR